MSIKSLSLYCCLLVLCTACASVQQDVRTDANTLSIGAHDKITIALLKTGEKVVFDEVGGRYVEAVHDSMPYRAIVGVQADGTVVELPLDRVEEVRLLPDPALSTPVAITSWTGLFISALALVIAVTSLRLH